MTTTRYLALGGEPAVGKSTLMMAVIDVLRTREGKPQKVKMRAAEGLFWEPARVLVLGRYGRREGKFPGTDRLSMAAQPDVLRLIDWLCRREQVAQIYAEGDRLYNLSMLDALAERGIKTANVVLRAEPSTIDHRHKARQDSQKRTFIQGRLTKISNVSARYPAQVCRHETPADTERLTAMLLEAVYGPRLAKNSAAMRAKCSQPAASSSEMG